MMGRSFIEFMAIGATASGIILATALPSIVTAVAGSALVVASVVALVRHYWVMTEPATGNFGTHE